MFKKIKVVIITLKEYPERLHKLTSVISQLESIGLNVEILYGVNGSQIQVKNTEDDVKILSYGEEEIKHNQNLVVGPPLKMGEFGCAWSHFNVYKKLLSEEVVDRYIVLEDDAELICHLEYLRDSLQNLPENFDVIRTSPSRFFPFNKIEEVNPYYYKYEKRYTSCTSSYIISKSGVKKILEYTKNDLNYRADDLLSNMYLFTYNFISYTPANLWFSSGSNKSLIHLINTKSKED